MIEVSYLSTRRHETIDVMKQRCESEKNFKLSNQFSSYSGLTYIIKVAIKCDFDVDMLTHMHIHYDIYAAPSVDHSEKLHTCESQW